MTKKKQFDKNDLIMTLLKGRTFIVLIILVVLFAILNKEFPGHGHPDDDGQACGSVRHPGHRHDLRHHHRRH